ncbi:hypothetical protein EV363DRAFT_1291764 [Boletus edulis]|nr:hypothetical protein EV363DRAFT_1291764 [Boletus edulis]
MTQIKNRGWLFYNQMVLLVPNVGADNKNTHGVALNSSLSLVNPSMVETPAFQSNDLPPFDATQNFADINVDKLLQVTTAHFQILNASKCKSKAHTPAMSLSYRTSCCTSSVGASKWNHVSQAKFSMANAAPLNGMVASAMLNNDNHFFTAKIHGKLAYSFIKDKDLCQVYIELTDSELRKSFVNNWYQETYSQLPPELSSTHFFSGTQTAQLGVYTSQSDGNVPSLDV